MFPDCKLRLFYQNGEVQAALQPGHARHFVITQNMVLAECSTLEGGVSTLLLSTDKQASPLSEIDRNEIRAGGYTPYGLETLLQSWLGFTGQLKASGLNGYFLGNGYRFYNPALMRFHSPDSLSPFSVGGTNGYMYCSGDPVNFSDHSGHAPGPPKAGTSTSSGRSRSPSPRRVSEGLGLSLAEVLEHVEYNPEWSPPTVSQPEQRLDLQATMPVHGTASGSPGRDIASIKTNVKAAVKKRDQELIPSTGALTPDQRQYVLGALKSTAKNVADVRGSVKDPQLGLTYNNYLDALALLSRRDNA